MTNVWEGLRTEELNRVVIITIDFILSGLLLRVFNDIKVCDKKLLTNFFERKLQYSARPCLLSQITSSSALTRFSLNHKDF